MFFVEGPCDLPVPGSYLLVFTRTDSYLLVFTRTDSYLLVFTRTDSYLLSPTLKFPWTLIHSRCQSVWMDSSVED